MTASNAGETTTPSDGAGGNVVVVTGAGQGLGRNFAQRLAERRYRVVIAEAVPERAALAEKELRAAGHEALAVTTDVTDEQSVDAMVQAALDRFGRIDGLLNNAGIYDGLTPESARTLDRGRWARVMDVNVWGTFVCCRAVYPALREVGGGRIVNIASSAALLAPPMFADYVASKGAVIALTRALAREWGPDGITVNAIAPGGTWTEATEHLFGVSRATGADPEEIRSTAIGQQSIARQIYPDDLVGAVAFLLSDESAMMSGQTLVVDGGQILH